MYLFAHERVYATSVAYTLAVYARHGKMIDCESFK